MTKSNYPKFTQQELAELAAAIYPDRNEEALKATLLKNFRDLRQTVERLLRKIQNGEDALSSGATPPERIRPTQSLVNEARHIISGLELTTSQTDGLEENQKAEEELIEAVNAYYHEVIKLHVNSNNSKKNEEGSFCYEIHNDDLIGLRPMVIDLKKIRKFFRFRDSKDVKAIEFYKSEKRWSEVVWVSIDGTIFALNISKDPEGRVLEMKAIKASLPRQIL